MKNGITCKRRVTKIGRSLESRRYRGTVNGYLTGGTEMDIITDRATISREKEVFSLGGSEESYLQMRCGRRRPKRHSIVSPHFRIVFEGARASVCSESQLLVPWNALDGRGQGARHMLSLSQSRLWLGDRRFLPEPPHNGGGKPMHNSPNNSF